MVGSGTTVYAAVKAGIAAFGFDIDPLAVLMTRVRTTYIDVASFLETANRIAQEAASFVTSRRIPAIDDDPETAAFVDYWFARQQQYDLRALVILINAENDDGVRAALQVGFSRLIVTKDKGASLGRDVSHSRPHRVRDDNDFNVIRQFELVCARLADVLKDLSPAARVLTSRADARGLAVATGSVDFVITSPPYLNAIDYLRGHRLSLVWLGYSAGQIRSIRAESVGAERGLAVVSLDYLREMRESLGGYLLLNERYRRIVDRYLVDLYRLYAEQARILKHGRRAVTVIGNSALRGAFLDNANAAVVAACQHGLAVDERYERELPADRRYLPPPKSRSGSPMLQRMRTETVLRFQRL